MWTWFGAKPVAEDVRQAFQIVLETRQRPDARVLDVLRECDLVKFAALTAGCNTPLPAV
jgi:hypothetical protein